MNGLKIANSMLNKYELLTICTAFKRNDSASWNMKTKKITKKNLVNHGKNWHLRIYRLNSYLNPGQHKSSKWWCKLHDVTQWQSFKVQYNNTAANLCGWFEHGCGNRHLDCTKHISQWTFVSLPFFCKQIQMNRNIIILDFVFSRVNRRIY